MLAPLARLSRAGLAVFAAACLMASFAPTPARATRWVVDQNGGGDFTTIQAALDAFQTLGWRDSILVMPGSYAEIIVLGTGFQWFTLLGVGGPGVTEVNSLTFVGSPDARIEDITFTQAIELGSLCDQDVHFRGCVFRSTVRGSSPSMEDCDFYGRTALDVDHIPIYTTLRSLRFHSAPLHLRYYNGDVTLTDCTFEGPADTLLFVPYVSQSDPVTLRRCRFEDARYGLVAGEGHEGRYLVDRCSFSDLSEAGVWHQFASTVYDEHSYVRADIWNCRFERCGTAVSWKDLRLWSYGGEPRWAGAQVYLVGDTILASTRDGADIGPLTQGGIYDCVIEGSGGNGAVLRQEHPADRLFYPQYWPWGATVSRSRFTNNQAAGLVIQDTTDVDHSCDIVDSCTFARNGGPGLQVSTGAWSIDRSVSFANGGDGFRLDTPAPGYPTRLIANTSVLNQGDGVDLAGPAHPGDSLHVSQHNLAALNAGTGFRVPHQSFGSFAFNDAWGNYQSQYVGAWASLDSNLTVDPRFCDLSAGASGLGLQQGSPCGTGGVYGLIGALPEQCPNTTAVETSAPRLTFAVRPTIARGTVEFAPPSFGPDGRIELFDLSGRRLWGAAFGPTTGKLRWQGRSDAGQAQPGLYWVRFTRAGETQSQRLVWLR